MSKSSAISLSFALCLHSVLEGVAAGISDDFEFTLMLCISISLHKGAAAVALGTSITRAGLTLNKAWCPLLTFALSTTLGIILGMMLHEQNAMVNIVVNTLSAGTFVYVSCTEIIQHEFVKKHKRWLQFLLIVLGGVLIIGLS
jgi:zinc transporter 1/2/3